MNTLTHVTLKPSSKIVSHKQQGFSLIELMIGLAIGLIAVIVIMQVFSVFEGQKRTTTGTSDAQTNGAIALYAMSHEIQSAGFGLAAFDGAQSPLNCPIDFVVDHDADAGTDAIKTFPITITDGGAGSDIVTVRYGSAESAGIPVSVNNVAATKLGVSNNLGCKSGDTVIAVNANQTCVGTRVTTTQATLNSDPTHIDVASITQGAATITAPSARVSCVGVRNAAGTTGWNEYIFSVSGGQLQRKVSNAAAEPVVSDIVMIQAQYGISASVTSNQISSWVDATGDWVDSATKPTLANRKLIKAVRVAVVARNSKLEKEIVTTACSSEKLAAPTGLCAWDGADAGSDAPKIDLSGTANWDRYRYRVYETVIPLRNMVWSLKSL
jgi:type IV pilus assembly protein PilW